MNVSGLGSINPVLTAPSAPVAGTTGTSFNDIMKGAIGQVENSQSDAARSVEQFLSGEGEDLHSAILSTQRADLEFQMFMQVRNRVVSAYQEVMKMQL